MNKVEQLSGGPAAMMTVHDVAEYLRLSEAKVYRLAKLGQIPCLRIGKTWRFRKDLLDEWIERGAAAHLKDTGELQKVDETEIPVDI